MTKDKRVYCIRCWIPDAESSCIGLAYWDDRTAVHTPFRLDMDNGALKERLITFLKNGMTVERYDKPLDGISRILDQRLGLTFLELHSKSTETKDASPAGK